MHDPAVLAFTVPSLVDVWHHDPSGVDTITCNISTSKWRWHVHHYRLQFLPWRRFRRRHFTRCVGCGRTDRTGAVNCSPLRDHKLGPWWWPGESGLYHADCLFLRDWE